ncbi:MAG: rubredoxin [Magnetococcales bacterium]|nr:rubredoxin [Magnetococcales bacterium]MBF0157212.1 rubredoxin [Magnetococcales bacterium]
MKKYRCTVCGFEYDESAGLPDDGLPPGTLWADVPESWVCPDCGVSKLDFKLVEV